MIVAKSIISSVPELSYVLFFMSIQWISRKHLPLAWDVENAFLENKNFNLWL